MAGSLGAFGELLRSHRLRAGWTPEELAEEPGIGPGAEIRAAHLRVLRRQIPVEGAGVDRPDRGR